MSVPAQPDQVNAAIASIEKVSSRIEEAFAGVGRELGRGHAIFLDLNQALTALSTELSGAEFKGASDALQGIAGRLNTLAKALPAETAMLGQLGKAAAEASELLKPLFKHIQMISIIARSARIEAASLADDRENFLAFTQEAYELAKAVQRSLEGCARDKGLLSKAIETALNRQNDFDRRYRDQLLGAGGDLISAYAGMQEQRGKSVHLADLGGSSTRRIAESVGRAIVSLQAGDSTRQRLEHICHGLRLVDDRAPGLVPASGEMVSAADRAGFVCQLEATQLKDSQREFDRDTSEIMRSLSAIVADVVGVVSQGRSLYGSQGNSQGDGQSGDASSFLDRIRQSLAQASSLIATCEGAGKSVDDALVMVEDTLGKFRDAITNLAEAVVDITLIGMNASLKAGHLGSKGNAFVVIANELKATADQVSGGAARLKPVLDGIERSANELRTLRVHGDPAQLAALEPSILDALREVEAGNGRFERLIGRLVEEGAEFEALMASARRGMTELDAASATLPTVAMRLESGAPMDTVPPAFGDDPLLDQLFAQYTMEREREVHRDVLQRFGLSSKATVAQPVPDSADDGVLLF
jgi:hypothetical protein